MIYVFCVIEWPVELVCDHQNADKVCAHTIVLPTQCVTNICVYLGVAATII